MKDILNFKDFISKTINESKLEKFNWKTNKNGMVYNDDVIKNGMYISIKQTEDGFDLYLDANDEYHMFEKDFNYRKYGEFNKGKDFNDDYYESFGIQKVSLEDAVDMFENWLGIEFPKDMFELNESLLALNWKKEKDYIYNTDSEQYGTYITITKQDDNRFTFSIQDEEIGSDNSIGVISKNGAYDVYGKVTVKENSTIKNFYKGLEIKNISYDNLEILMENVFEIKFPKDMFELKESKAINIRKIANEIYDLKEHSTRWKSILRQRFEDGNGIAEIRQLRNHFDYDKLFRLIKKDDSVTTIIAKLRKTVTSNIELSEEI